MAKLTTQTRLRKALRKVAAPQTGWLDIFPAIMGRVDGTVLTGTPGVVYVRNILNGQVLAVFNATVPNIPNLQVEVGKRVDMPGLWQIKGLIEPYGNATSAGGNVGYHAPQHQFPDGADIGWWDRKQLLAFSVLVSDPSNFIVRVYGGVFNSANGIVQVDHQLVDLSAYVVTFGAKFVSIETDEDGTLSIHEGDVFAAPSLATVANVPVPDAGKYMIAFVLFYEGQTELSDDDIRVVMPLGFNASGYLTGVDWGDIGGTLSDQTDLQSALDGKSGTGHTHEVDQRSDMFSDGEGNPADVITGSAADGTSSYAARRDHVHHIDLEPTGQYRQFVYEVSGGDFSFVIDEDGRPVMALEELE
jgi:hypothetical protein